MAFNRIEYGSGIKTLKQDERHTEPDTGEHTARGFRSSGKSAQDQGTALIVTLRIA